MLVFNRLAPGVYDTPDGRMTLYRIEGCTPPAWNVEWTVEYQNWLGEHVPGDYSIVTTNIVDGAATKRDAVALAQHEWTSGLSAEIATIEGAACTR